MTGGLSDAAKRYAAIKSIRTAHNANILNTLRGHPERAAAQDKINSALLERGPDFDFAQPYSIAVSHAFCTHYLFAMADQTTLIAQPSAVFAAGA